MEIRRDEGVSDRAPCPVCRGRGRIVLFSSDAVCEDCAGTGIDLSIYPVTTATTCSTTTTEEPTGN